MYSKECFLNDYAKPLAAKDHAIYEIINSFIAFHTVS